MNGVISMTDLLWTPNSPTGRDFAQTSASQASTSFVINDILDVSKIEQEG
jgi:hypothetical protein